MPETDRGRDPQGQCRVPTARGSLEWSIASIAPRRARTGEADGQRLDEPHWNRMTWCADVKDPRSGGGVVAGDRLGRLIIMGGSSHRRPARATPRGHTATPRPAPPRPAGIAKASVWRPTKTRVRCRQGYRGGQQAAAAGLGSPARRRGVASRGSGHSSHRHIALSTVAHSTHPGALECMYRAPSEKQHNFQQLHAYASTPRRPTRRPPRRLTRRTGPTPRPARSVRAARAYLHSTRLKRRISHPFPWQMRPSWRAAAVTPQLHAHVVLPR